MERLENTKTDTVTVGYSISRRYSDNPRYGVSATAAESVTTKPEKVTFIPPKSISKKVSFYLMPQEYFMLSKNKKEIQVPYSVKPKKKTTVFVDSYTKDNSPVSFRNYIAISDSEDANKFAFIDNEFYVSDVREMCLKHFRGKNIGYENGETVYEKKDKKPFSFYLYVPNGQLSK